MDKFEKKEDDTSEKPTDKNSKIGKDPMREYQKRASDVETSGDEQEVDKQAAPDGDEGEIPPDIDSLKEEIEAARKQIAETHDRYLRTCAEFDNYKKIVQRRMEDYKKYSNTELIKDLLPVVDNLERAVDAHKENRPGENQSDVESCMAQGVEMTLNEIRGILRKYKGTPIESQGKVFDPNYHEAVMQEESDNFPDNTVKKEFQKGYLLHDRLIRPAMVVVSKGRSTK